MIVINDVKEQSLAAREPGGSVVKTKKAPEISRRGLLNLERVDALEHRTSVRRPHDTEQIGGIQQARGKATRLRRSLCHLMPISPFHCSLPEFLMRGAAAR